MHIDVTLSPPTAEEIAADKKQYKRMFIGLNVVVAGLGCILFYNPDSWLGGAAGVLAFVLALVVHVMLNDGFDNYAVIDGHGCYDVKNWQDESDLIKTYVTQVKEQKRELIKAEFSALKTLRDQKRDAMDKQKLYN